MKNILPESSTKQNQAYPKKDSKPLISVTDLNKQFNLKSGQIEVLHDINFSIPEESFTIIFGPSGSGKSTILNVLSGLEQPTQGRVIIDGQDLYGLDADQRAYFRAHTIGIVHQDNYWMNSLNVLENVAMPLYLAGSPRESALAVALDSLRRVGMDSYKNYLPTVLSGGQQQRVSMARALVATPKLILADEPTGDLDSKNGQMIMDLLLYFQRELKRTIVLVTHNLEYLPLSDNQLYILDGKIMAAQRNQKQLITMANTLSAQIAALSKMEDEAQK
jgi:putative ABC transport system ATP-binding protein